jgi:hypothetical protein
MGTDAFYKSAWSTIRNDVMAAVQAFTLGDYCGLASLNSALIVLLPNKSVRFAQVISDR